LIAALQVAPLSVERITPIQFCARLPTVSICVKTLSRLPSSSTTMRLPMVCDTPPLTAGA
jgi:hypothetical protein